jgi:hypothetical protein
VIWIGIGKGNEGRKEERRKASSTVWNKISRLRKRERKRERERGGKEKKKP